MQVIALVLATVLCTGPLQATESSGAKGAAARTTTVSHTTSTETPKFAQVYGVVTDSTGAPVSNARLEFTSDRGRTSFQVKTSAAGVFTIDSLTPGESYTLIVSRLGYRATMLPLARVRADSARKVHVVMQPRKVLVMPANARLGQGQIGFMITR